MHVPWIIIFVLAGVLVAIWNWPDSVEIAKDKAQIAKHKAEEAEALRSARKSQDNVHTAVQAETSKEEEMLRLRTKETDELIQLRAKVAELEKKL